MTSVVSEKAGALTVKLQSCTGIAASDARFSVRDMRYTATCAPTTGTAVRSKVKLFARRRCRRCE